MPRFAGKGAAAAWCAWLAAGLAATTPLRADPSGPLAVRNLSPLTAALAGPVPAGGRILARGAARLDIALAAASHSAEAAAGGESISLDGETWRFDLRYERGLGDGWELGLAVPLVVHENGLLDGLIDTWHDLSGLPDGERDSMPSNRLGVTYIAPGTTGVALANPVWEIGDLSFTAARALYSGEQTWLALRVALELPTGRARTLTGSGQAELAAGLHLSRLRLDEAGRLSAHAGVGFVAGDGDPAAERRRQFVPWINGTLAWRFSERYTAVAQVDAHGAFYASELDEIGATAVMFSAGLRVALDASSHLELVLSEDPTIDRAPDVVFQLRWLRVARPAD